MKISYNWLKEYTGIEISADKLSAILTGVGLEVEGVENYRSIPFPLQGVMTAEVLTCEKHPGADRLSLTTVDAGTGNIFQVVCGAPNVAAGQKVLLATVGTRLPDGKGGSFEIKEAKIRGEVSQGMICAEDELGLGDNHDGIMVLDPNTPVGIPAETFLNLYEDTIFEIGLTPNRSDANNHLGVALDVIAYFRTHKEYKGRVQYPVLPELTSVTSECPIVVKVEDTSRCIRYSGLYFSKVNVKESPDWIKNRLEAIGQTSINNIVDITNYVLWEMGQPLHAFDGEKVKRNTVIVQTLHKNAEFLALDGKKYSLHEEDLMICDADSNPMCMAGVYGGQDSGVSALTSSLFLESAVFSPSSIRRSAQRHHLHTSAAKAYEKGLDPERTIMALLRAADLLIKYADAEIQGGIADVYPEKKQIQTVNLSLDYLTRISGVSFTKGEVLSILDALEMPTEDQGDQILVTVPGNKPDVNRPADLAEEILRIYGLDNIPLANAISYNLQPSEGSGSEEIKNKVLDFLCATGYSEMMSLSLSQSEYFTKYFGIDERRLVKVMNTSNTHLDCMRANMFAGGLEAIAYNINRKQQDLKLVEAGFSYQWGEKGDTVEREQLVIWQTGKNAQENWLQKGRNTGFFTIKSVAEALVQRFGLKVDKIVESEESDWEYGVKYILGEQEIMKCGMIQTSITRSFDIRQDVFAILIEWEAFLEAHRSQRLLVKEPGKFPEVRRDLALVVDKEVRFEQICALAMQQNFPWLKEIGLFDVYSNAEQLGANKKSYAVNFMLEPKDHTLSDKELDSFLQQMIEVMEKELGAVIRR